MVSDAGRFFFKKKYLTLFLFFINLPWFVIPALAEIELIENEYCIFSLIPSCRVDISALKNNILKYETA